MKRLHWRGRLSQALQHIYTGRVVLGGSCNVRVLDCSGAEFRELKGDAIDLEPNMVRAVLLCVCVCVSWRGGRVMQPTEPNMVPAVCVCVMEGGEGQPGS